MLAGPAESADVWDEAFFPLATGCWTRGDASTTVVGSLTKLFACPGLRLGYVVEPRPAWWQRAAAAAQPIWSVNSLALAALPDLLDAADLPAWSSAMAVLRSQLRDELAAHGLVARPSDANWLLGRAPQRAPCWPASSA